MGFSHAFGGEEIPVILEHSDIFEIVRGEKQDTIYIRGSAVFRHGDGRLWADTAIWIKGETLILKGHVRVRDTLYQLYADRVDYNIVHKFTNAYGEEVILISEPDSLKAVGTNAYFSRDSSLFRMKERPHLYLNYPDTARLIHIEADDITFESKNKIGYADGNVDIFQEETEANSERAILYVNDNIVLLLGEPSARRRDTDISGDTLIFFSDNKYLRCLYAQGNAVGNFNEPSRGDSTVNDVSELKAEIIEFNFDAGSLENITAARQAYSFYKPGTIDSSDLEKNYVSGDSINLFLTEEQLSSIEVIGGAEGKYLMGGFKTTDSGEFYYEDTIYYESDSIRYFPDDSTISLVYNAAVSDKKVSLTAARIDYNTAHQLVTAYDDSTFIDTLMVYVPVILKDVNEEIIGSYLEYSIRTEKGMIRQSRSEYQEAYYRGQELFREKKNVFYVENGMMTSCDREEPHWHFRASRMKVIQGDRAIARPVVFYIEKIPLLIVPYYVFPLKSGRHSGFLQFRIGNFERGGRFIKNVGYYWAASEYWDLLGSFDYTEGYGITYNGAFKYNLRYHFSGSVSGSFINESYYDGNYNEVKGERWNISFNHSQTFSPTFSMKASGQFISDKSYYTDYSTDLEDRLNRSIKSQVSFSKKLGSSSLSAQFVHTDYIDKESRTDLMPTASFTLPSRQLFGSGSKGADGKTPKKWYHGIYAGYSTQLRNYSQRTTDTLGVRSRREYMTINHSSSMSAPFKLMTHLKVNPSFRYTETWYEIFETDQSLEEGIDAGTTYRRYAYSMSASASTDLYGMVSPNVLGLEALRHVVTPSVSFSWAPEFTKHDNIKSYTGVGSGGSKQRTMSVSLRQLLQAKVKSGEESKKLDLLTINSSFSYNFEATGKKFSSLSTTAQTSLLKNLKVSASMVHDLYAPGTEEIRWWSPYLTSFSVSTTFNTKGLIGAYEMPEEESSMFPAKPLSGGSASRGWSLSLTHYYRESGRGSAFSKIHTVNFNINVALTPNLNITYRQYYDFVNDKTITRSIQVEKKLHCWEGRFSWTIDGSNTGYQFRINVTAIPDIKFEKSESDIRDAFF